MAKDIVRSTEIKGIHLVATAKRVSVASALRVAAAVYEDDAKKCGPTSRTGAHFAQMAKDTLELAEAVELDVRYVALT